MPLFIRIQFIIKPTHRIFVDVSYVFFIIIPISNNVVIEMGLPYIFTVFFIAEALKR